MTPRDCAIKTTTAIGMVAITTFGVAVVLLLVYKHILVPLIG